MARSTKRTACTSSEYTYQQMMLAKSQGRAGAWYIPSLCYAMSEYMDIQCQNIYRHSMSEYMDIQCQNIWTFNVRIYGHSMSEYMDIQCQNIWIFNVRMYRYSISEYQIFNVRIYGYSISEYQIFNARIYRYLGIYLGEHLSLNAHITGKTGTFDISFRVKQRTEYIQNMYSCDT